MATITATSQTAAAPVPRAVASNPRVQALRSTMMVLISASVALGLLLGLVAWAASANTYSDYRKIVDEGSVSVDAALRARAAVLDHMGAAATYLETTGDAQREAEQSAEQAWAAFNNEARISWRNISDRTHGEENVYSSVDRAASDYIQQIGAMFAYNRAGQTDQAREAFLLARETLNTRLVPALGGMEAVKVEAMEATYAGASQRISNWATGLLVVAGLIFLVLISGLLSVRRMHYRWSNAIGAATIVTVVLALSIFYFLTRAAVDARVMVRDAYDNVAGAQGLGALLSQARALESIAVFDPEGAPGHLESFNQYNALVEQQLCGPRDCSQTGFLSGTDRMSTQVVEAALDEQDKLGLPRPPLVANVHFRGQAAGFEALREAYRGWLDTHARLGELITGGQRQAAASLNTSEGTARFAEVVRSVDELTAIARREFDNIWQGVYTWSTIFQVLAVAFPIMGVVAALGLWRRRSELFA